MEPHQQRVVDEKAELDEKINKLDEFVNHSTIYPNLEMKEKMNLTLQLLYMQSYSRVLGDRIEDFTK